MDSVRENFWVHVRGIVLRKILVFAKAGGRWGWVQRIVH